MPIVEDAIDRLIILADRIPRHQARPICRALQHGRNQQDRQGPRQGEDAPRVQTVVPRSLSSTQRTIAGAGMTPAVRAISCPLRTISRVGMLRIA